MTLATSTPESSSSLRRGDAKLSRPTDPIIDTFVGGRERRAHATAWLAPLPPGAVWKLLAVKVSPAAGIRGVTVMRSVLREPIIRIDIVGVQ